ncbi:MAG: hypothetical protein JWM00_426 [Candidatus Saccharibacteria bacterium]|nr:hypothetical protein [Candidatus Saccharibacteria bacterium]
MNYTPICTAYLLSVRIVSNLLWWAESRLLMVLKEFLQDLDITTEFFNFTGFIDNFAVTANIAQNAKNGTSSDWRTELDAQITIIDEAVLSFEVSQSTLLIENSYIEASDSAYTILNYRSTLINIFDDILTADVEINRHSEELRTFRANTVQIKDSLEEVGINIPKQEEHDGYLVKFEFKQLSDFDSMGKLGATGHALNRHIRSLMKLDPDAPLKDIEISTVSKSSPFMISVWLTKKAADAINAIIGGGLENYKKMQEIQVLNEDVKKAKLGTRSAQIGVILDEARADLELSVINELKNDLMVGYPPEGPNGTKSEVEEGVAKAIQYLVSQTGKGLEVKVLPPTTDINSDATGRDIIKEYAQKRIRAEQIMKQLPNSIESDDSADEVEVHPDPVEDAYIVA